MNPLNKAQLPITLQNSLSWDSIVFFIIGMPDFVDLEEDVSVFSVV